MTSHAFSLSVTHASCAEVHPTEQDTWEGVNNTFTKCFWKWEDRPGICTCGANYQIVFANVLSIVHNVLTKTFMSSSLTLRVHPGGLSGRCRSFRVWTGPSRLVEFCVSFIFSPRPKHIQCSLCIRRWSPGAGIPSSQRNHVVIEIYKQSNQHSSL